MAENIDKSTAGSLRRIAQALRAAPAFDTPTAATALETEADFLDPKGAAKDETESDADAAKAPKSKK
jgi:hypothetical protein